jgi:N-carbamoylputrescine amidase
MKINAAAIQMASVLRSPATNLECAESLLKRARDRGVELAVLPEMFNTGYGLLDDFHPEAEERDGPTLKRLADLAQGWGMTIAAGFVEREGHHLYDSMALILPDRSTHVYRKRHLVFWERFRFRPGRESIVVSTPFGRVGLAICADMIYKRIWEGYRDRIDLALISSAWPEFADTATGRKHWLFGHVGPMSGEIPGLVARDLGIPVVFANQCGETQTVIPILTARIRDRFAGRSCLSDGRHASTVIAGIEEAVVESPLTIHAPRGPKSCHFMSSSAPAASASVSEVG